MIFTLEALEARHGDCLILHLGDAANPCLCLIDGGPATVFGHTLGPRLETLRGAVGDPQLTLDLVMVSHVDDDHIHGILDLTDGLIDDADDQKDLAYSAKRLWHNAFEEITGGDLPAPAVAAATTASTGGPPPPGWDGFRPIAAVIASVPQGKRLRANADRLNWPVNDPVNGLITAGTTFSLGGATITVVAPDQAAIDALRAEWEKQVAKKSAEGPASLASYVDDSPYNLSSIVCLVEAEGKSMLLTGDSRGDGVLTGLEDSGKLAAGGTLALDVLKLPHHGSDRDVADDFFRRLPARHYVVSGNGKYGNPEIATLRMITASRVDDDFTLHLTNGSGEENFGDLLSAWIAEERAKGRQFTLDTRADPQTSVRVDLLDAPIA
jgi:hypothetical protein